MTEKMEKENILGTLPIGKLLRKFAIPSCISLIVNALYNIVDQVFIGRGVGYLGNGATNVVLPMMIVAIGISLLFGDGCAAYFSIALGRGNKKDAANSVGNAFLCVLIIGIIIGVVCNLFLESICWLCGATDLILPYAMDYGRVIAMGLPLVTIEVGLGSIIRTDGSPRYSMMGLVAGCAINIVLDYLFVFPLQMGVRGAAIATVLGQLTNFIIYIVYFFRFKQIQITRDIFHFKKNYITQICKLGISSFILQISTVIVMIVMNNLLVRYGAMSTYGAEIPMTAMGVTMKIYNILLAIMMGIGAGALPIVGYNYGAGKMDRAKQTIKQAVIVSMICGVVATVCFQVFPRQIVSIFGNESELYMEFSVLCLRIFLALCILDGLNNVIPPCFQALDKPKCSILASSMRMLVFNLPPALILPIFLGVRGVLFNGPIAAAAAFILNIILIRRTFKSLDQKVLKNP